MHKYKNSYTDRCIEVYSPLYFTTIECLFACCLTCMYVCESIVEIVLENM